MLLGIKEHKGVDLMIKSPFCVINQFNEIFLFKMLKSFFNCEELEKIKEVYDLMEF